MPVTEGDQQEAMKRLIELRRHIEKLEAQPGHARQLVLRRDYNARLRAYRQAPGISAGGGLLEQGSQDQDIFRKYTEIHSYLYDLYGRYDRVAHYQENIQKNITKADILKKTLQQLQTQAKTYDKDEHKKRKTLHTHFKNFITHMKEICPTIVGLVKLVSSNLIV